MAIWKAAFLRKAHLLPALKVSNSKREVLFQSKDFLMKKDKMKSSSDTVFIILSHFNHLYVPKFQIHP